MTPRVMSVAVAATLCLAGTSRLSAQTCKPDSATHVTVSGPVVVAFFAVTQCEIDNDTSDNEWGTVVDDFQHHLANDQANFRRAGVRVVETYADTIRVSRAGRRDTLFLPRRKPAHRVGYVFLAPGRPMQIHYDVMTDVDLWCAAASYFRLSKQQGCS